jgi:hypothetical protein
MLLNNVRLRTLPCFNVPNFFIGLFFVCCFVGVGACSGFLNALQVCYMSLSPLLEVSTHYEKPLALGHETCYAIEDLVSRWMAFFDPLNSVCLVFSTIMSSLRS